MQRPVGCCVSDIGKERTFWCFFIMVPNKRRCLITDSIREKIVCGELIVLNARIIAGKGIGFPEVSGTGDNTIIFVKPALAGPTMLRTVCTGMSRNMPLSTHICAVAFRMNCIGNSNTTVIQVPSVTFKPVVSHHVSYSRLVRM